MSCSFGIISTDVFNPFLMLVPEIINWPCTADFVAIGERCKVANVEGSTVTSGEYLRAFTPGRPRISPREYVARDSAEADVVIAITETRRGPSPKLTGARARSRPSPDPA